MLSAHDDSMLGTFMVGLIVLVFAGIGLSIAVDRRFSFSSQVSSLERELKAGEVEFAHLSEIHRESTRKLQELEPERRIRESALNALKRQLADLQQQRPALGERRDELNNTLRDLEAEFSGYRRKYRETVWNAAVGRSVKTLRVRGGREYQNAVITRVTDVGLEIRHLHGTARVSALDLDSALQDHFQWDDEQRRASLDKELAAQAAMDRMQETARHSEKSRSDQNGDRPGSRNIDILRGQVIAWRYKGTRLRSERNRALSSAYGTQASPPGSLETWKERVVRLSGELARAEAELDAAKARLATVSPDDELLKSPAGKP